MTAGCTVGALHLGPRLLVFKNKDLVNPKHIDRVVFDKEIFAAAGTVIGSGETAGVSIGINRLGLAGCSSTVLATEDRPYDHLLEAILRNATHIDQAYAMVQEKIASEKKYQWCNLILGDSKGVAVIEISEEEIDLEKADDYVVRTNHHVMLNTSAFLESANAQQREAGGPIWTSRRRRQKAERKITGARTVTDIAEILSDHSENRGFDSICRHTDGDDLGSPYLGQTVYSYIMDILYEDGSPPDITFHVAPGNPCMTTYRRLDVDFDVSKSAKNEVAERYPKRS